jgi:carboxypeptidase PM20D1
VAGTDSRHYGVVSDAIYRFSPMVIRPRDLEQIHGNNEHMNIADYMRAIAFYETILEEGAGR